MTEYSVGDFGYFEFEMFKKTKYGYRSNEISGHFEIKEVDPKNILLSDGQSSVIVTRRRITKFEKKSK